MLYEDDQIPKAYFAQCQKQLWLSEQEYMYLVVWLTAEIRVRVYKIYRNEDFIKLIQETEREFLFEHVIPQSPYETDFKPLNDEYSEKTVFADSETIDAIEELQQLNLNITSLDKRKKQLTNLIKDKIGDYEACVDVQGNTLATLRRYSTRRFDFDALLNDHPEYAGDYKTNETTRLNLCKQKNI